MARDWQGSKWIRPEKRLAIYARDGFCCVYCGASIESGATLTLDHVIAHALGGSNDAANLVTCCGECNSRKRDLSTRPWFACLRSRGIDTGKIGPRIRRLLAKPIDVEAAKAMIAARA